MSIIGGANNPLVLSRIDQNFGHEHAVYIRYLHESGISDIEIVERIWTTFADKFIVAPGVSDERREKDLKGKVAVYTCKWADIEAPESEVSKFAWGTALIEEMTARRNGGIESEVVENLIIF